MYVCMYVLVNFAFFCIATSSGELRIVNISLDDFE